MHALHRRSRPCATAGVGSWYALPSPDQSDWSPKRIQRHAALDPTRFGEPLAVDISIGVMEEVESPMRAKNREADEHFAAERAKLEADPNVQALKDMFDAELKPESIKLNNPSQD